MLDALPIKQLLSDGTVLSLTTGLIVVGSLMYNARLWLQDYPKPIRDRVPPLNDAEKRDRRIVAILIVMILIRVLLFTALQLKADHSGPLSFGAAYLSIFLVLMTFNLFDAVVIDFLLIMVLRPKFVILPGMEGMENLLFQNYRKQFE